MSWGQTIIMYAVAGMGVGVAVYLSGVARTAAARWLLALSAIAFWPLYVPFLLAGEHTTEEPAAEEPAAPHADEMATLISQVEAELQVALGSLDGWAEDVLARESDRLNELRSALRTQADRIREMDRLLANTQQAAEPLLTLPANERIRSSEEARLTNIKRLKQVRERTYQDLMGTLAWLRELVSMIHLAKFTGAPASRAEELVAQIASVVEGLSALTWQEEANAVA